jgi:hypothetical protein
MDDHRRRHAGGEFDTGGHVGERNAHGNALGEPDPFEVRVDRCEQGAAITRGTKAYPPGRR